MEEVAKYALSAFIAHKVAEMPLRNFTLAMLGAIALGLLMLAVGPAKGAWPFLWKLIALAGGSMLLLVWGLRSLLPPKKAKLALTAVFVVGVASGLTLFGLEFAVRLLYSDITTTADNSSYFARRWYTANPQTLNEFGFRERSYEQQKPPGTFRIAVVGDSFAYGQGISRVERFSDLLQADLKQHMNSVEVLNFGRPGAETVDHVEILTSHVLDIEPDFVLLQWFINDPEGHDKSGMPANYPLVPSKTASRWLHRNSALYHIASSAWGRLQVMLGWAGTYEDYMRQRFENPLSEDSRRAQAQLSEFIEIAKASNIGIGMVVFPTLSHEQPFSFLVDQVLHVCAEQQIQCVDLRPEFRDFSPIQALHVNRLDAHPGPIAHRIAATAILRRFSSIWAQNLGNPQQSAQ